MLEAGHVLRMDRLDQLDETGPSARFTRIGGRVLRARLRGLCGLRVPRVNPTDELVGDLPGGSREPSAAGLQVLEGSLGLEPLVLVDRAVDQLGCRVIAQVRAVPIRLVHEQGEKAVVARRLRLGPELEELLAARLRGQVPIGHHGEKEGGALDLFLQLRAPVVAPLEHVPVNNEIDGSALVVAGLLHCSGELDQCAAVVLVVGVHIAQEDRWVGRGGRSR